MKSIIAIDLDPKSTSKDYYWTLGIPHNATDSDINKAYRKLAVRWHPKKSTTNKLLAEQNFRDVCEAYQVLVNRPLRQLYDKSGRDGLLPDDVGIDFDGFDTRPSVFPFRDAMDVYMEFFGGTDPHDVHTGPLIFDEHGFEHSFPGFPRSTDKGHKLPPQSSSGLTLYKGHMVSGPTEDDEFKSVCVTTKVINGKVIVKDRTVSGGVETVTVNEDGRLRSKTIDGEEQLIM